MNNKKILKEIKSLNDQVYSLVSNKENIEFPKLSSTQLLIMDYILDHNNEVILQKDLEDVLMLTKATVSSVLKTLEKYNIITRVVSNIDTRTKNIVLTKKALEFYNYGKEKMNILENNIKSGISESDLNTFFNVIEKMKTNMERMKKC